MSDGIDLQNILQTGFFTTSRARHAYSSSSESQARPSTPPVSAASRYIPRSLEKPARYRRSYPPPPVVEDEIISLAKEFKGLAIPVFDEEPRSRGEVDQQPIIEEVFEHNPERRFVVVPGSSNGSDSGSEDKAAKKQAHKKAKSAKPSPSETNNERKQEPEPERRRTSASFDDTPNLERRKSRQDLPRIETDLEEHETPLPTHHRSKSCAGDARPNFTSYHHQHHHRVSGDEFLSPEVTKLGLNGRDSAYYDYGRPSGPRSQTPSGRGEKNDPRWDGKHWRSSTPATDERSSPRVETSSPRVSSYDKTYDSRHRDGKRSPRSDTKDRFDSHGRRRDSDLGRSPSSRKYREHSWSGDEGLLRNPRHRSSLGVPQSSRDSSRVSRSPSRVRTMPVSSAQSEGLSETEKPYNRASATFPIIDHEESQEQQKSQLPYPDDDDIQDAWFEGVSGSSIPRQLQPGASMASMPHIPPVIDEPTAKSEIDVGGSSPLPSASQSWQPPSFEPEKENASFDRPVGSYRRYSDAKGKSDKQELPECSRAIPVAGLTDWITLPRTDFNICPDCYGGVFAPTQYRTDFQPMLRPTVNPIACDFGSSPWYRIAWLLTLKEQRSDLQLFYKVANAAASTSKRPCPGSQKALEFWYTVKDPFTRRAVPDFTVCYECTKMVEALFPTLRDVFGPQDAWKDPVRNICALHFTPERKQFALYFDAFETTAELAFKYNRSPDIGELCMTLSRISTFNECRESRRVTDGYWYTLSFLPEFTVCGECYREAVEPQKSDGNDIAQSFHSKPRKLPVATCQLYSPRMRGIFKWACRRNDPEYLQERVRERMQVEEDIHARFVDLVRDKRRDAWTDEQIDKLDREWKKWE
ncbi:hypothetical protein PT974_06748 [Cladobotryum mycophilum]|uniref:Uncharacterized protein n=1 Tax=Cladobotryum mycophilum TaxID=491253 RepID=A0ABR0SML9_9HYPO